VPHLKHGSFRIGELARAAGTSPDTLRHYERVGVLPAARRTANGYRVYPASALARVRLVRRALAVGFTLEELARILKEREEGGAPCREVRALASQKLGALEEWLAELGLVRDRLRELLAEWDGRLAGLPAQRRARLLEALGEAETHPADVSRAAPLRPRRRSA
jgi:DNA-binding transcriptional MerR regulator